MAAVEQRFDPELVRLLDEVARRAAASRAFSSVEREGVNIRCIASANPDAAYEVCAENDALFVSWVSPDRYLSQSIEADLMWTGDDLKDLIEEELADLGCTASPLGRIEHFRDEAKRFTFRSRIAAHDAGVIEKCLLAFERAFAQLGDMKE